MARTRHLERLTASDLFLLLWDDYGWSTDIGGLAVVDGAGLLDEQGRVRVDTVRRHLSRPRSHRASSGTAPGVRSRREVLGCL